MDETRIGGVEPLHQRRDPVFEMRQRRVVGVGELNPFELFDESESSFSSSRGTACPASARS